MSTLAVKTSDTDGELFVKFASDRAGSGTIYNDTGVAIDIRLQAADPIITLASGSRHDFPIVWSTSEVEVRRNDQTATAITVEITYALNSGRLFSTTNISSSKDVQITNVSDSDLLQWNGSKWVNVQMGWDDERFPTSGINPTGTVSDPTADTTETGFPGTFLFSGSADNLVVLSTQIPHAWEIGSSIFPHIHWSNPTGTANAVTWQLYYRVLGDPGEIASAWVGPVAATLVAGNPAVSDNHCLSTFGGIETTGLRESSMILFRIYRRGSSDASSGTARLYEFDYHYKKNKFGTPAEYPV